MTTQSITSGQERQMTGVVVAAAESAIKELLAEAPPDKDGSQRILEGGDQLKAAVKTAARQVLMRLGSRYPVLSETKLLCPVATANTPARAKSIDLDQFFRNRPGLYVWDTLRERFDLGVVQSAPARPYVASLLKANAHDRSIRQALPEQHLSTLEDIAGFIETQPEGKQGFLLNNGYANIFYVMGKGDQVFAVDVYWSSVSREWYVLDYALGEAGEWSAGYQVLCPGNAAL